MDRTQDFWRFDIEHFPIKTKILTFENTNSKDRNPNKVLFVVGIGKTQWEFSTLEIKD